MGGEKAEKALRASRLEPLTCIATTGQFWCYGILEQEASQLVEYEKTSAISRPCPI